MSSYRLFWKLFLAFLALHVVSATVFYLFVTRGQKDQLLGLLEERLETAAMVLRSQAAQRLADHDDASLTPLVRELARETNLRMTIIAPDGTPLADSDEDPAKMENHKHRPEVLDAARRGRGVATRHSATIGKEMMYVAMPISGPQGGLGFVRVALPTNQVYARLAASLRYFWMMAVFIALFALLLTYLIVGRIIGPIATLTSAAQSIAQGVYNRSVSVPNHDELGTLAEAFNRMSRELDARINQLRENGQRLATVLGSMVEGVIAVDEHQTILLANEAARRLLACPSPDMAGRPLWEVVRNRTVGKTVDEAFEGHSPSRSEFEIAGLPRKVVALHTTCLPGDPCPGVVLVLHDVTELRRLEHLRQDFVANVSHELKTPLSSIKAYAETLLNGALDDKKHNVLFLHRIEEQAERLHTLIVDMLSLARIESGREAFEIRPVPVSTMAQACVTQHLTTAAAKGITLLVEPPPQAIEARADEEGLRTILDNLVDNAIKYTPAAGRVTIRWAAEESMLRIEVEDTGIGIALQDQARIFERFYRVDKARSRELGGTGLGLSIVKHLAQAFGGNIAVKSRVGAGSTFLVRLPLAAAG